MVVNNGSLAPSIGNRISVYWLTILVLELLVAISILFVALSDQYGIANMLVKETKLIASISSVEHPTKITMDLKAFVGASSKIFIALQSYLVGVSVLLLVLVISQTILLSRVRRKSGPDQ